MKWAKLLPAAILIAGCSSYSAKLGESGSIILPTSNRSIDVVLHRSDVRLMDCATLTVIQTYDTLGMLIDAKSAQGRALHCGMLETAIQAGGTLGAGYFVGRGLAESGSSITNTNEQSQGQSATAINSNVNKNNNVNNNVNSNSVKVKNIGGGDGEGGGVPGCQKAKFGC